MSGSCSHSHSHGKAFKWAIWIAFIFMIIEIIGGLVANSLALISDALHMFTDVGALFLGFIVVKISQKPSTHVMSYGYERAESLGALASAASLWILCGLLVYEAVMRFIHPEEVQGPVVFVIATFGLFANLAMMRILHGGQSENLNVRAAYLHVVGDLLGSVAVILSGIILWLTQWNPIDPIITIIFAFAILFTSGKVIRQSVRILMESAPAGINPESVLKALLAHPLIEEVHDLHIWSLSSKKAVMSAHIITREGQKALNAAHALMQEQFNIEHMTIQIEEPGSFDARFCYDCDKTRAP